MEERSEGNISRSLYLKVVAGCAVLITILIIASVTVTIITPKTTEYTTPEKLVQSTTTTEEQISKETTRTTNAPTTSTTVKEIIEEPETIPAEKPAGPDAPETPVAPNATEGVKLCDTKLCIDIAARLLENMNPSVDPCDDFYENACGSYSKNYHTKSSIMASRYHQLFWKTLNKMLRSEEKHKSRAVEVVKQFFVTCKKEIYPAAYSMTYEQDEEMAAKLFGASEKEFDLTNALKVTMGQGLRILFELVPPSAVLLGVVTSNIYVKPVIDIEALKIYQMFGNESLSYFHKYAAFKKLNNDQMSIQDVFEKYKNPMKLEEMEQLVPQIRWRELVQSIFPNNTNYDPLKSVVYFESEYMKMPQYATLLSDNNFMRNHFYYNYILEIKEELREKGCQKLTYDLFPRILMSSYSEENINRRNIEKFRKVFEDERESYRELFNNNDYLDDNTKKNLIRKLDKIRFAVLALDEEENLEFFDKQVETLDIKGKPFLDQLMEIRQWKTKLDSDSYARHPERELKSDMFEFTAQYGNASHKITVSSFILNNPFFDADAPDFLNYGSPGFIVAHEIGHAFDAGNRKKNEHAQPTVFQNLSTSEKYDERAKCLVDQFDNIEWKGYDTKVNGTHKLDENQADNTGIKVAYNTFKRLHPENELATLPGLEQFTEDQLFYYSSAMWMCTHPANDQRFIKDLTDEHTYEKLRVNSFKNDPNFAKTFNCKKESKMNPVDRCIMF